MQIEKMSVKELEQLLRNCNARIEEPKAAILAAEVAAEMHKRNAFKPSQWKGQWNSEEVAEALEPFRVVAVAVPGNQRTPFTTAGGLRIGVSHMNAGWKFVDAYSAIKTDRVNAVFSCQVDRPGDDAVFSLSLAQLQVSKEKEVVLEGDRAILQVALERWRDIAKLA